MSAPELTVTTTPSPDHAADRGVFGSAHVGGNAELLLSPDGAPGGTPFTPLTPNSAVVQTPLGAPYLMDVMHGSKKWGTYNVGTSDGPVEVSENVKWSAPDFKLLIASQSNGGSPALKEIYSKMIGLPSENIFFVSGGTSMANHCSISAVLYEGGHACVEHPAYDPLPAIVHLSGCGNRDSLDRIYRKLPNQEKSTDEEDVGVFGITVAAMKAALACKPRLIIITNPHNPSGKALRNLPDLLKEVDAHNEGIPEEKEKTYILVDEVYGWGNPKQQIAATLSQYAISTGGATKTFGLSGLRLGVIVAHPDIIQRVFAFASAANPAHAPYMEEFWKQFLEQRDTVVDIVVKRQEERTQRLGQRMQEEGIEWVVPDLGGTACVRLPVWANGEPYDDHLFVSDLLEKYDTVVVPCSWFHWKGWIRVALARPTDEVFEQGVSNIIKLYREVEQKCQAGNAPTA